MDDEDVLSTKRGLQCLVDFAARENTLGPCGIVIELNMAVVRRFDNEIVLSQTQPIFCSCKIDHIGTDNSTLSRALEQREHALCILPGHNRDSRSVDGLVTECEAKSKGKQKRKDKDPEDYFPFARELFHPRAQQVAKTGPAAVAERRRRGDGLGLSNWSLFSYRH